MIQEGQGDPVDFPQGFAGDSLQVAMQSGSGFDDAVYLGLTLGPQARYGFRSRSKSSCISENFSTMTSRR